ncbi:rRNA pseudouridine synthase [Candidatus Woesearchaeota archaeon]|nr:rRNA pseudouridine synthase [Candidatus Woesearchaeota archaeon]
MKLIKYLIQCGIGSRRKCISYVDEKKIKINNEIAESIFQEITQTDKVKFNDKLLKSETFDYYVLNKPKNYICSNDDKFYNKLVINLLPKNKRLFTVGRLDKNTTGLILITNDGNFANDILHPSKKVIKSYEVIIEGKLNFNEIKFFKNHVKHIGKIWFQVEDLIFSDNHTKLIFKIIEGKKHIVKNFFTYNGVKILDLKRMSIGNLNLTELQINDGEYKKTTKTYLLDSIFKN